LWAWSNWMRRKESGVKKSEDRRQETGVKE